MTFRTSSSSVQSPNSTATLGLISACSRAAPTTWMYRKTAHATIASNRQYTIRAALPARKSTPAYLSAKYQQSTTMSQQTSSYTTRLVGAVLLGRGHNGHLVWPRAAPCRRRQQKLQPRVELFLRRSTARCSTRNPQQVWRTCTSQPHAQTQRVDAKSSRAPSSPASSPHEQATPL